MVEPILYASLGALIATLIGLTFLPLFWRRAVKLTTRDLISRLPVSASEIVATQDRLRAEHAMSLRQTERKAELVVGDATRDRIESARARATELGHLADLADLRSQVAALESEGVRVRGELDRTGAEAVAAFEALKEARAAADAAARDLQAARQDASASRSAMEQARIEAAAREREIARLKGTSLPNDAAGDVKPASQMALDPRSTVDPHPKIAKPFALGDGKARGASTPPDATAKTEPGATDLASLRKRLDEVADALVKAAESAPAEAVNPASIAAMSSEPARSKPAATSQPEPAVAERAGA